MNIGEGREGLSGVRSYGLCRELCMNIGEGRDSSLHLTIPPFPREGGIVRCREP